MTPLDCYEIADAGIANGAITMIAAIVRLLEEKSIVPVDEFATALEATAAAAKLRSPLAVPSGEHAYGYVDDETSGENFSETEKTRRMEAGCDPRRVI